ncbi:MAG: hypothetical protein M3P45_09420 [Acidobacteriota bacterium]|nr:hypothetical protein [Acidobacteriota bacterium]
MCIREYSERDLHALREIHARQGFKYALPDLNEPLFVTKLVVTDKESSGIEEDIVGAALLRLTAEAYLLLDPRYGTPRERWQALLSLHAAAERDAWRRGLEDVHAWLPPGLEKKFGKRIEQLGWVRDDAWTPYCHKLSG